MRGEVSDDHPKNTKGIRGCSCSSSYSLLCFMMHTCLDTIDFPFSLDHLFYPAKNTEHTNLAHYNNYMAAFRRQRGSLIDVSIKDPRLVRLLLVVVVNECHITYEIINLNCKYIKIINDNRGCTVIQ